MGTDTLEEFKENKKKKVAQMTAMQALPYEVKVKRAERRAWEFIEKPDGTLYTTKAQRTGCSMCGFGVHIEKRPHRFDLLRERNPKEWEFYMYWCCTDEKTGEKYGWGRVLDYIGVEWENIPDGCEIPGQMSIDDFI